MQLEIGDHLGFVGEILVKSYPKHQKRIPWLELCPKQCIMDFCELIDEKI